MTQYPLYNPTSLFAGDQQPVHDYVLVDPPSAKLPNTPPEAPATFLFRGTVLGPISSGASAQEPHHHVPSVQTASDGSNVPLYVLAADADLSGGAAVLPVYEIGEYAYERLFLDASWTFPLLRQTLQETPACKWRARQLGPLG